MWNILYRAGFLNYALALGCVLSGCLPVSYRMNRWVGKTEKEVLKTYGKPTARVELGDGVVMLSYVEQEKVPKITGYSLDACGFGVDKCDVHDHEDIDPSGWNWFLDDLNYSISGHDYFFVRRFYMDANGVVVFWRYESPQRNKYGPRGRRGRELDEKIRTLEQAFLLSQQSKEPPPISNGSTPIELNPLLLHRNDHSNESHQ